MMPSFVCGIISSDESKTLKVTAIVEPSLSCCRPAVTHLVSTTVFFPVSTAGGNFPEESPSGFSVSNLNRLGS